MTILRSLLGLNPVKLNSTVPTLHTEHSQIPTLVRHSIDAYVHTRDQKSKNLGEHEVDPDHKNILKNHRMIFLPGWGNFPTSKEVGDYWHHASGGGSAHIQVAPHGGFQKRAAHWVVGSTHMSLAAHWIEEFPTVLARLDFVLPQAHVIKSAKPDKEIYLGHSKGGLLVYLLAALRQAVRDNRLAEFKQALRDTKNLPLLREFSDEKLISMARALESSVLGAVGTPFYGVSDEFLKFAQLGAGRLRIDAFVAHTSKDYSGDFLQNLYRRLGYQPESIMDFVVTSHLAQGASWSALLLAGPNEKTHSLNPFTVASNLLFNGLSRFIHDPHQHDGMCPARFPVAFKNHLIIPNASHLDQVEDIRVSKTIIDYLSSQRLV